MKLILALLFTVQLFALDCKVHKIYCKIVELKPRINKTYAKNLSDLLYKYSKTPMISVAIGMQESGLVFRHRRGKVYYNNEVVKGITDFGTFQIHVHTAQRYGLDLYLLETNLEYNVIQHSIILANKIRSCRKKLGKEAFSCYHSYTKSLREDYYRKVRRFL